MAFVRSLLIGFAACTFLCLAPAIASAQQDQGTVVVTRPAQAESTEAAVDRAPLTLRPIPKDDFAWLRSPSGTDAQAWRAAQVEQVRGWLAADKRFGDLLTRAQGILEAPLRFQIIARRAFRFEAATGWGSTALDDLAADKSGWRPEFAGLGVTAIICDAHAEKVCLLRGVSERGVTYLDFTPGSSQARISDFSLPAGAGAIVLEDADTALVEVREAGVSTVRRLKRGRPWSEAPVVFRAPTPDGEAAPQVAWASNGARVAWITLRSPTLSPKIYIDSKGEFRLFAAPEGAEIAGVSANQLILKLDAGWEGGASGSDMPPGSLLGIDVGALLNRAPELSPTPVLKFQSRPDIDAVFASASGILVVAREGSEDTLYLCSPGLRGWGVRRLDLSTPGELRIAAASGAGGVALVESASFPEGSRLLKIDLGTGVTSTAGPMRSVLETGAYARETHSTRGLDGSAVSYVALRAGDEVGPALLLPTASGAEETAQLDALARLWIGCGGQVIVPTTRRPVHDDQDVQRWALLAYEDLSAIGHDAVALHLAPPGQLVLAGVKESGLVAAIDLTKHPAQWAAVALIDPLTDPLRLQPQTGGARWLARYDLASLPQNRSFWLRLSPYENLREGTVYPPTLTVDLRSDEPIISDGPRFTARMNAISGQSIAAQATDSAQALALTVAFLRRVVAANAARTAGGH